MTDESTGSRAPIWLLAAALAGTTVMLSACGSGVGHAAEEPIRAESGLPVIPLTIETADGRTHRYRVEIAATPKQQERGLMFRRSMPADAGMLFPYDPPQLAAFWMANTYIPLDLIFISADGTVGRIAANAVPESRDPIPSGGLVKAVLELNGGEAARIGLSPGDKVGYRLDNRSGSKATN